MSFQLLLQWPGWSRCLPVADHDNARRVDNAGYNTPVPDLCNERLVLFIYDIVQSFLVDGCSAKHANTIVSEKLEAYMSSVYYDK